MNIDDLQFKKEIGGRIRKARVNAGFTQIDAGLALGQSYECAQGRISKLEKGNARLNGKEIITLAKLFHVSSDYLLGISNQLENKTELSVSDVFKYLFELEKVGITLSLEQHQEIVPNPINGEPHMENMEDVAIRFTHISIVNKLKEWAKIKDVCMGKEDSIYKNVYDSWKKGVLSDKESVWKDVADSETDIPF